MDINSLYNMVSPYFKCLCAHCCKEMTALCCLANIQYLFTFWTYKYQSADVIYSVLQLLWEKHDITNYEISKSDKKLYVYITSAIDTNFKITLNVCLTQADIDLCLKNCEKYKGVSIL